MLNFENPSFSGKIFYLKALLSEKPSLSGEKPDLADEPRFCSEKPSFLKAIVHRKT